MSPSLTSGFSGSGDCKSTETCSLLSVASYSSATPTSHAHVNGGHNKHGAEQASSATHVSNRHVVTCEVCHLPFPSRAVLEHHLMGSRHARKVKAESVLRQLQVNKNILIKTFYDDTTADKSTNISSFEWIRKQTLKQQLNEPGYTDFEWLV